MSTSKRVFSDDDQRTFAAVSGDHNPFHLDPVAARRTQAGAPVVHGVHLLLWMIDTFSATHRDPPAVSRMRARFNKFVFVGEEVEVVLTDATPSLVKLTVAVHDTPACQVSIHFGEPTSTIDASREPLPVMAQPTAPLDPPFDDMLHCSGRLSFAAPSQSLAGLFPSAAAWLGSTRLAALAACSNVVGMVCPGLHSIFSSLALDACRHAGPDDGIEFRVITADPRFRLVRMSVAGGGFTGTIESIARLPPTIQAPMAALTDRVHSAEFAGTTSLIVGGSRGIGELTAKLITAGGGRVIITYHVGKSDAERVATEIRSAGGSCEVLQYDVRQPASEQLSVLVEPPTHLYYFATSAIFGRQSNVFDSERLERFLEIYVHGFWRLIQALRARRPGLSILYPSSVAVVDRPRGMTEYSMAKAAGEILCASLNEALAPLRVLAPRLPRMATDQTATFMQVDTSPALETMLPLIREVQSWSRDGRPDETTTASRG
jgi:NAD(P)-dependent dehydrogenase (short-subunit alcohol dehydrogenase family)